MYNRDHITVMVRNSPAVAPVSDELLQTIRNEWERIFGQEGTEKQNDKSNEEALEEQKQQEAGDNQQ